MTQTEATRRPAPRRRTNGGSRDHLVRTISTDGQVLVRAIRAPGLLEEAVARRPLSTTALDGLGRLMMGSVLLAVGGKGGETVQLEMTGDGPLGAVIAISDPLGRTRGTVSHPAASPPLRDGQPDFAAAIGAGVVTVVRHRPAWREPHIGRVPIYKGEVAKDLALYLAESEQIASAVGLGVMQGDGGEIRGAAGFLVQALPGVGGLVRGRVEENVMNLGGVAALVERGAQPDDLIDCILDGIGSRERHSLTPEFHCPCTRERARRSVALLGRDELSQMVADGEGQEVCCQFCGEQYQLEASEIGEVLAALAS